MATNIVASGPTERGMTGMPTAPAKEKLKIEKEW